MQCIQELVERQVGQEDQDFIEWDDAMNRNRRGEVDRFMQEQQFPLDGTMISLDQLDSYLEMLYEDDMEDKIKGTFMILQVCTSIILETIDVRDKIRNTLLILPTCLECTCLRLVSVAWSEQRRDLLGA